MFGVFIHPRQIGSRKPVAEMSVPGVSRNAIQPGHEIVVNQPCDMPAQNDQSSFPTRVTPAVKVRFTVSYRLSEYLTFVQELGHARLAQLALNGGKPQRLKNIPRWLVAALATPVFLMKRRLMPTCRFVIDESSIVRSSATGHLTCSWKQIIAIHRCSLGFIVQRTSGAMPIPFRCLSEVQLVVLERFVSRREAELAAATSTAVSRSA